MKNQITLVLLSSFLALSASAKEILVHEEASALTAPVVTAELAVNAELGRAWIEIGVLDAFGESGTGAASDVRVKVPGLVYDRDRSEITYDGVVCAVVKQNALYKLFKTVMIKPTKNCSLSTRSITRDIDNGYEIEKTEYLQVFLNVRGL